MNERTRRELLIAGAGAVAAATLVEASSARATASHTTPGAASHTTPGAASQTAHADASHTTLTAAQSRVTTKRLERLLSVELLMLFTYEHVLGSKLLDPDERSLLAPLRAHEQAHIRALSRQLTALGGVPPAPPADPAAADKDLAHRKVKGRLGQLRGRHDALQLLVAVERVVVGAYFVALIKVHEPQLITLLTQIMASDAQHEAIIGELMYRGDAQKAVPYGLVQGVQ
jgi:Ferritin-like domain